MDNLGRYHIVEELGRGAMGTVFRGRDPKIDRLVAIKTIRAFGARPGEDEEYRKRFFREAQAAGKLSHPGIVTIYDVGEQESTQVPYIVMEYIAGRTLENLLTADDQRPSVEVSLDLVRQLAEALDYAHAQNIVHRDIKPANIIVTPEGRAKIMDFGVARLTQSELTVQGQLVGTPAYMSPEQLKGDAVDGRSDLFSLGVILYWLLTGEKAFTGEATTIIAQILYAEPNPVTHSNPSLSSAYDQMISQALAKAPAARYQRGREFADAIGRLPAPVQRNPLPAASVKNSSWRSADSAVLEKTALIASAGALTFPQVKQLSQKSRDGARRSLNVTLAVIGLSAAVFLSALLVKTVSKPSRRINKSRAATNKAAAPSMPNTSVPFAHKSSGTAAHKPLDTVARKSSQAPLRKASDTSARKLSDTTLQVLCWHDFDSAHLSVWVENNLVYETKLMLSRKRSSGYLSTIVRVPIGEHMVRVQVKSNRGNYSQSRTINVNLVKDVERTLEITCNEVEHDLHLAWQN